MSPRILIVDDSLTVRMDLAEAFEEAGFDPTLCATGAELRAALTQGRVDLVILDVHLPDADGLELIREMRDVPAANGAAVLLLSTEAEVKDRIRGLQVGADDYVGKPYDVGYVVARARELIGQRAGRAERVTVLVVDDSPTFRAEIGAALEAAGYAVIKAANGEEGLKIAAASRPSAILVDGVMPGMDGAALIRRVRLDAALRGTPCVLLTASDEPGSEIRALDAGADAFVRKDERVDVLLARIAAVLRGVVPTALATASLLGPKRILAVDDSPTYLERLSEMLRKEGYDVVPARSGEEAIDMLAVQEVDCILLDLMMPGIDGRETCRRIKASPIVRDIPLIMLTALEDRAAMLDSLATGADDFISKSSEFEILDARVRAQLRRKQFEDEHRKVREELLRAELRATEERAARELAEARAAHVEEVEEKNRELEAFSYSVSHDLRAPLRTVDGFSLALLQDNNDQLDDIGRGHIARVRGAAQRMGELIDDLLNLSRVSGAEMQRGVVDISEIARGVVSVLRTQDPARQVMVRIHNGLFAEGDARLVRVLLENLLGNAWKFTSKTARPEIEVGANGEDARGQRVFFVRDNGVGFDMLHAEKLFSPFRRLHRESEFPGTGIGLATVHRIVGRHGGRVWVDAEPGKGATVSFVLGPPRPNPLQGSARPSRR